MFISLTYIEITTLPNFGYVQRLPHKKKHKIGINNLPRHVSIEINFNIHKQYIQTIT